MLIDIEVIKVNHSATIKKRDGTTYEGTQLVYQEPGGEVKTENFHPKSLEFNGAVAVALKGMKPGDVTTMEKQKNDAGFWNVKSFGKSKEEMHKSAPTNSVSIGSKYVDNSLGMQVGHAINNAVALAIAEKMYSLDHIEGLANDIIAMSERLKSGTKPDVKPAVTAVAPKSTAKKAAPKVEDDEEDLFADD